MNLALRRETREKQILEEIRGLRKQVAEIKGERDAVRDEISLSKALVALKTEKTDLEIDLARVKEQHEREKREIEHMVGLERKRREFEIDSAKRDTTLTVREENLTADRERFEKEMQFTRARFEEEVGYLKSLMGEVLERLPTVKVDRKITELVGAANGRAGDDAGENE